MSRKSRIAAGPDVLTSLSRSSDDTPSSDDLVKRLREEIDDLTCRNTRLEAELTQSHETAKKFKARLHHFSHHCTASHASQSAHRLGFKQGFKSGYSLGLRNGSIQGFSSGYDQGAYNQYLNTVQSIVCACRRPTQTQPVTQAATTSEGHSAQTDSSGADDGFQALLAASQMTGSQQTQPREGS